MANFFKNNASYLSVFIVIMGILFSFYHSNLDNKNDIGDLKNRVIVLELETQQLKIDGAVNQEILKSIDTQLADIRKQLDTLSNKR